MVAARTGLAWNPPCGARRNGYVSTQHDQLAPAASTEAASSIRLRRGSVGPTEAGPGRAVTATLTIRSRYVRVPDSRTARQTLGGTRAGLGSVINEQVPLPSRLRLRIVDGDNSGLIIRRGTRP